MVPNPDVFRNRDVRNAAPSAARRQTRTRLQDVPVEALDPADHAFQYRLRISTDDLYESIRREGQQEPIHLLEPSPYRIVDGFRRVEAIRRLGSRTVRAFVHDGLTEEQAHSLAFVNNVVRKNLSPLEKAHGIHLARQRGRNLADVARCLGLSEKQVRRYEQLIQLPEDLLMLVDAGKVPMTHALVLVDCTAVNVCEWALKASDLGWSVRELKRHLPNAGRHKARGRRVYARIEGDAASVFAFRISRHAHTAERDRAIRALQDVIAFLSGGA
jgi:ParB/RepB/Spo0J family partition protein